MALFKGFRGYVIDSNDAVIANLGIINFPCIAGASQPFMSQRTIDIDTYDSTYFSPYTNDYGYLGNALPDYWGEDARNRFNILAPLTTTRTTFGYAGYRLKLGDNTSGYYAIGNIGSQGYISSWNLYDNNNNLIASGVNGQAFGFPLCNSIAIRNLVVPSESIVDGMILTTAQLYYFQVLFNNTTTSNASAVINYTNTNIDFINWYNGLSRTVEPEPAEDPYFPGGYSGTGGGGGGQNFGSDVVGFAPLPTLSFADTGFWRIYNPTLSELRSLATYMWTDASFLQTVINHAKQLLENPMESIISLSLVPVHVVQGTPEIVKVLFISTGVTMGPVTNQFVEVDCGTLALPVTDQYGAALDFNPYTSIDLYLPYIGQVTIDIDEVMYKTMHCVYRVDVVTGMCVACISVLEGTDGVAGETVLYQFAGHCGIQMPLTSADFSGYVGAIIGATKMVAGLAAAGAGAPGIAAGIIGAPSPQTSRTSSVTTENGGGATWSNYATTRNPKTGRQITAATSGGESTVKPRVTARETTHTTDPPSFGELAMRGAVNTVDGVMGGKMHVEHSGGFTGTSGYIAGVRRPYAIIKHPNQCYPENYSSYKGFPAMIYMSLGDCDGYTEVHDIQINGMSATNPELGELAELLKTGVIF